MIGYTSKGDFSKTLKILGNLRSGKHLEGLEAYGRQGVSALRSATPVESGETAASWDYKVEQNASGVKITWFNTHNVNGVNIAIILQYGHATGTGGYVQGRDYINPAIQPTFDKIDQEVWKKVKNA